MARTEPAPPRHAAADSAVVDVALAAVILMWASTFTLFKIAWRDVDPVAFTALRFASMVVFSSALVVLSRDRVRLRRKDLPLVIASGLSGYFLYQMMFILGLDRTSAVASSVLVATHPIFSVLFAWMLWRDRPARHEIAGVVVAFIGVTVFLQVWHSLGEARLGDLLSLGAAASFGFYGVITRPLTGRYPAKELMAYTLAVGGLLTAVTGIPAMAHQDWGTVSAAVLDHPRLRDRRPRLRGVRACGTGRLAGAGSPARSSTASSHRSRRGCWPWCSSTNGSRRWTPWGPRSSWPAWSSPGSDRSRFAARQPPPPHGRMDDRAGGRERPSIVGPVECLRPPDPGGRDAMRGGIPWRGWFPRTSTS